MTFPNLLYFSYFALAFSLFIPLFVKIKTDFERLYRVIFFLPVFFLFWLTLSLVYLDGGFFSDEIMIFTSRSYAWLRVFLLSLTFIVVTRLIFTIQTRNLRPILSKEWSFFEKFIFCAIFLFVITLLFNLPCLDCILDKKLVYKSENFLLFLLRYVSLISFLIGYFFALVLDDTAKKNLLYLTISMILILFAIFIILGHKFGQFIDFTYLFLIGFSLKASRGNYLRKFIVLLSLLFLFTFLAYKNINFLTLS